MAHNSYNEARLREDLNELLPAARSAFAAASAERLRPAFRRYADVSGGEDAVVFEAILDRLWRDLDGDPMSDQELASHIETAMEIIPDDSEEPDEDNVQWMDGRAYAEDAGAALAYALRCRRTGDAQEAAWAARRVYEAVDACVLQTTGIDVNMVGAEARVLAHPLVQQELARQHADLDELRSCTADVLRTAVARVRDRAVTQSESTILFGPTRAAGHAGGRDRPDPDPDRG